MVLLFVKATTGKTFGVEADLDATVFDLKCRIFRVGKVPMMAQKLIFGGKVLKDDHSLTHYNITKECSVQLFESRNEGAALSQEHASYFESVTTRASSRSDPRGYPPPKALHHGELLTIHLIAARNLVKSDFWTGSSDPYLLFILGDKSVKSTVIKRNVNPEWDEVMGFLIDDPQKSIELNMVAFDYDNFTPDDFIGSAKIDVASLPYGKTTDQWIALNDVSTGEVHIQITKSILSSPGMRAVTQELTALERPWRKGDLVRHNITLDHLMGFTPWFTRSPTQSQKDSIHEPVNPAIEHLSDTLRSESISWDHSALERVQMILDTQHMLPVAGKPSTSLWMAGIDHDVSVIEFYDSFRHKFELDSHIKHVVYSKTTNGSNFAVVQFCSIEEALEAFLCIKRVSQSKILMAFGRSIIRDQCLFDDVRLAGFIQTCLPGRLEWAFSWLSMNKSEVLIYEDLHEDKPRYTISLSECYVCSHGLNAIEVFVNSRVSWSFFIQSEDEHVLTEWKNCLRQGKSLHTPFKSPNVSNNRERHLYLCSICDGSFELAELYSGDNMSICACFSCLRQSMLSFIANEDYASLKTFFSMNDMYDILRSDELEAYLDSTLQDLLASDESFTSCPDCGMVIEVAKGTDTHDFSQMKGIDGRPISKAAQEHFNSHRVRCRNTTCSKDFCKSCGVSPYHLGFSCTDHDTYLKAPHCRFCKCAVLPQFEGPVKTVCNAEDCVDKYSRACHRQHSCGCFCGGIGGETECLPCMEHAPHEFLHQSSDDFCNICFTESLGSCPSIQLECGHVFHYRCALQHLEGKWPGSQISFAFAQCTLCQARMKHISLCAVLQPIQQLHRDIEEQSYHRALVERLLDNEPQVQDPAGSYYNNPVGFAMKHFSYYLCSKCDKPYFGGQARCNDALVDGGPQELICPDCSGVGSEECPTHGRDHILYKCRFCCSPAVWFCWGTTHFCSDCHRRQEAHDYMTTKSEDELPQCPGPDMCKLGIEHPPNGTEFSLGCILCRGIP